jgi:ribosomal protein S12 methylthiotransferase accessory factor
MTGLRYVEIAPMSAECAAVRTFSRRWFTIPRPCEEAADMISSLGRASAGNAASAGLGRLRDMLIEGGSMVAVQMPPTPVAATPLAVLGDGTLCTGMRYASSVLSGAPSASPAAYDPETMRAGVLLLVLPDYGDGEWARLSAELGAAGQAWAPFVVAEGRGWLGPVFESGGDLGLDDLLGRLTANAVPWPGGSAERVHCLGDWHMPGETDTAWMASVVAADLTRYAAGEPALCQGYLLELDPSRLSVTRHPVLPLPLGERDAREAVGAAPCDLVDERTGVIMSLNRFDHHPDIPRQLISVHAHITRMRHITVWKTDTTTAGTSFSDEESARQAAIGEAVERYCGNLIQEQLLREATWHELAEAGEHAVDPEDVILFSERQYAAPGFPFVPFTRDLRAFWVPGRSLTRRRPAWLPASMCYGNWHVGKFERTPPLTNTYYAGLAAGPDLEFAIVSGLQEIIERHITMLWWANAQPLPAIRSFPAELRSLWEGAAERAGQRAWLIPLGNEFGVPVMAGVVEHTREQLLTIGFAARSEPAHAALKAWAEALTLQDGARNLHRQQGGFRQAIARGDICGQFIKPWRADRRYLDDYRPDFRDVVDLMCQLQISLDPRAAEYVRPWVDPPAAVTVGDMRPLADRSLRTYAEAIEARGFEIFYADLTTRDVARTGMRVVRVLVPGLIGNFAAAFPYQGQGRLRDAAVELGWRATPLGEADINLFPLPHA